MDTGVLYLITLEFFLVLRSLHLEFSLTVRVIWCLIDEFIDGNIGAEKNDLYYITAISKLFFVFFTFSKVLSAFFYKNPKDPV